MASVLRGISNAWIVITILVIVLLSASALYLTLPPTTPATSRTTSASLTTGATTSSTQATGATASTSSSTSSSTTSAPILVSPPPAANSLYEFHIYTSNWATAQPYVQAFLSNARNWGVPVWMGEFDAFEAGCTGSNCKLDPNWQADTQALLAFCDSNGINWAYFSYYSLGTSIQTPVPHSEILAVLRSEVSTPGP